MFTKFNLNSLLPLGAKNQSTQWIGIYQEKKYKEKSSSYLL